MHRDRFPRDHREGHRFTAHHVVLMVVLVGVALLLGDDTLLPTSARIPGMLVLGGIAGWLGFGLIPRGTHPSELARVTHPSRIPPRVSRRPSRPSRPL
jgi:hypothetical protein